jgi:hypothetical protein
MFRCGDEAGLVAYAYEDGEPAERAAVAAHVALCASCAATVESIAGTRRLLASWTPPDARLGFRVTDEAATPAVFGARPVAAPASGPAPRPPWWRQPLPAWAQAAAAAAIFGIGLWAGGAARVTDPNGESLHELRQAVTALEARTAGQDAAPATAASSAGGVDVEAALRELTSRVAQAEQRTASVEAAVRLVEAAPGIRSAGTAVTDRMLRQAIEQSERRQVNLVAQRLEAHRREQVERQDSRDERITRTFDERLSGAFRIALTANAVR